MWSSPSVAHLLQGLTSCEFRDALLHTSVVTSGYLRYCCFLINSNKSGHSPLTSGINKAFSPQNCHSLDILYFLDHSP